MLPGDSLGCHSAPWNLRRALLTFVLRAIGSGCPCTPTGRGPGAPVFETAGQSRQPTAPREAELRPVGRAWKLPADAPRRGRRKAGATGGGGGRRALGPGGSPLGRAFLQTDPPESAEGAPVRAPARVPGGGNTPAGPRRLPLPCRESPGSDVPSPTPAHVRSAEIPVSRRLSAEGTGGRRARPVT